jgi:glycerate dehydrogenase
MADGSSIVITNKVPLREETLAQAPTIRLIAVAAGTNVVGVGWYREHGSGVRNIRGYAVDTVPEHTFALILRSAATSTPTAVVRLACWQGGQFCFFDYPIKDLRPINSSAASPRTS